VKVKRINKAVTLLSEISDIGARFLFKMTLYSMSKKYLLIEYLV